MDVTQSVAVVGAGLIGRSWAIVFAGGITKRGTEGSQVGPR